VSSSPSASAVVKAPWKKLARRHAPLRRRQDAALGAQHELGAEDEHHRRHVGRRVGVGDGAADGAAVPHLPVADHARGLREDREPLAQQL
jgi:hypothetical protein